MKPKLAFLKTLVPDLHFGTVIYPAGSVVEVEEVRARKLFDLGHAEPSEGPASIPGPDEEPNPAKKGKGK